MQKYCLLLGVKIYNVLYKGIILFLRGLFVSYKGIICYFSLLTDMLKVKLQIHP